MYSATKDGARETVLIYDLGGGTLDVSIAVITKRTVKIVAIAGDSELGGADFDNCMLGYCVDDFKSEYENFPASNKQKMRIREAC